MTGPDSQNSDDSSNPSDPDGSSGVPRVPDFDNPDPNAGDAVVNPNYSASLDASKNAVENTDIHEAVRSTVGNHGFKLEFEDMRVTPEIRNAIRSRIIDLYKDRNLWDGAWEALREKYEEEAGGSIEKPSDLDPERAKIAIKKWLNIEVEDVQPDDQDGAERAQPDDHPGEEGRFEFQWPDGFITDLNKRLKVRVFTTQEGGNIPDLKNRNDLSVGLDVLREMTEEQEVPEGEQRRDVLAILNGVLQAKSKAQLDQDKRDVELLEQQQKALTDVVVYLDREWDSEDSKLKGLVVEIEGLQKVKVMEGGNAVEKSPLEIGDSSSEVSKNKSFLQSLQSLAGKKDSNVNEDKLKDAGDTLADVEDRQKSFENAKGKVEEFKKVLENVLKQFVALKKSEIEGFESDEIDSDFESVKTAKVPTDFATLKSIYEKYSPNLTDKNAIAEKVYGRRGRLEDEIRSKKKQLEIDKGTADKNIDITDEQFALKLLIHRISQTEEGREMDLVELEKAAKRQLLDRLWEKRTGERMSEAVDGAPRDLLAVMSEAVFKDRFMNFSYNVGGTVYKPFEGFDPSDFRTKRSIERLFKSKRMDEKKGFYMLVAFEKHNGSNSIQHSAIREGIFNLLSEERGLSQSQAIKAFNSEKEVVEGVMQKFFEVQRKRVVLEKQLLNLKVKRAQEKLTRGEISKSEYMDELEAAGYFKGDSLNTGAVSRLGFHAGWALNHRHGSWLGDKLRDIGRDTAKFLGHNLIKQPLSLAVRWGLKGGLALAGKMITVPVRLVGYPLHALRVPLHLLAHPIKSITHPVVTAKEAGAKVKESWKGKREAGKQRRASEWGAVKGEFKQGGQGFAKPKYEFTEKASERREKNPETSVKSMDNKISNIEKRLEDLVVSLSSDIEMDFSKYKVKEINDEKTNEVKEKTG
ncbi:hypothetical protein HOG17_02420 [Candidatus Peregrinibacteria bacterium]|jgi:surface antigen|nr:hypothetical protein [Candidatus Peregrinibacteria bacterium]MBT4147901.1 hypothetical protein [Candidatus Peregrinibacteria bacterium]MBT4365812.1 hypothetical protein [Candidatus Peregrinibacteria bacterium]MBT4456392.1 hypothetical protein [Candidatus Peregrinibacteria bacterium]